MKVLDARLKTMATKESSSGAGKKKTSSKKQAEGGADQEPDLEASTGGLKVTFHMNEKREERDRKRQYLLDH